MNKLNLSLVFMEMCYTMKVFHSHGKPYRSETDMDCLPCPPRGRIADLHNSKHGVHRKYWSYFTWKRTAWLRVVRPISGRLARIFAFVSGQTRASGECMGKGKCAPSSCVRHGAGRCWHGAQQQEKSEMNDLDVGSRGGVNAAIVENQE